MTYTVKEIFYTLQGEGAHAGTAAVFVRFAGCNLWSGREEDRSRDAAKGGCAQWCDTDFRGTDGPLGGRYGADDLAAAVERLWPKSIGRTVVLTGGEPALQVDWPLIDALHGHGFRVHMETNGTVPIASGVDWVTVSPKPPSTVLVQRYDEVKVVSDGSIDAAPWGGLAPIRFIQPRWTPDPAERRRIEARCVEWAKAHPTWRLSVQLHKHLPIDPGVK